MLELIDKQAALKNMCETCGYCESFEKAMRSTHPDFVSEKCNSYKFLAGQPTIAYEPVRHGRWVPTEYDGYADGNPVYDSFECSECGHEHNGEKDTLTAFCPDCGAKMDEIDPDCSPAITNGDKIRKMSDRQLADLFFQCMSTDRDRCERFGNCCWQCNYEWLKEVCSEDE